MKAGSIFSSRSHEAAQTAGPAPSGSPRKHSEVTLNNTANTFMPTNLASAWFFIPQINQRDSLARKSQLGLFLLSDVFFFPPSESTRFFSQSIRADIAGEQSGFYQCDFAASRSQVLCAAIGRDKSSRFFNTPAIKSEPHPKGRDGSFKQSGCVTVFLCCREFRCRPVLSAEITPSR